MRPTKELFRSSDERKPSNLSKESQILKKATSFNDLSFFIASTDLRVASKLVQ